MARGRKRSGGRRRGGPGEGERGEGRRFVGGLVAIVGVMMVVPACRVAYWWLERDHYMAAEVEVVSGGMTRTARTIRVRELATGTELWIDPLDFGELTGEGTVAGSIATPGLRFTAWFNPAARATAGIVLFDQRLVSRARHPELATGATVAGYASAFGVLATIAALLMIPPRRHGA